MAEIAQTKPKPPPLHERSDVFEDIAASLFGGNDMHIVQAEFRGALKILRGTAIPKNHDALIATITAQADTIQMDSDKDVADTIKWVESEQKRHAEPKKPYDVEHVWPPKEAPPPIAESVPLEGQPPGTWQGGLVADAKKDDAHG